jgi:hypothetical protein
LATIVTTTITVTTTTTAVTTTLTTAATTTTTTTVDMPREVAVQRAHAHIASIATTLTAASTGVRIERKLPLFKHLTHQGSDAVLPLTKSTDSRRVGHLKVEVRAEATVVFHPRPTAAVRPMAVSTIATATAAVPHVRF